MDMENEPRINVTRSTMPPLEEYVEEIKPIWENHWMTNMGPIYKKFQHRLMEYLGASNISMFTNGHMALEMLLKSLELSGEVITTPYTFISTTNAIIRNGLKPVFCDIKETDYTIDPDKIEELITDRTVAILPVHVYGNICDIHRIQEIADRHNLKVIYDVAHAFGVKYEGVGVANFGYASMFSLHATKVFNSVEGGIVSFKDEHLRKKLHCEKNFGITGEVTIESIGANAKLDEFRSAMGICNLNHLDENIAKRKLVYERYIQNLNGIPGLRLNYYDDKILPNYAYFPVYVDRNEFGCSRDDICSKLKEHNVYTRKYFYPATNNFEIVTSVCDHGNTPVSDDVSSNIITLPMYGELDFESIDRICEIIRSMK